MNTTDSIFLLHEYAEVPLQVPLQTWHRTSDSDHQEVTIGAVCLMAKEQMCSRNNSLDAIL